MDHLEDLAWRKSSYSGSNGGNCIEVATNARAVSVRDSKDTGGAVLTFEPQDWQRFTAQVRANAR